MIAPKQDEPLCVLIVDDDPGLVRLVNRTLQREGFTTAVAEDGAQAVAWLKKHQAALLLTDLKLPDMMGWEICQLSGTAELPFIVMTGQGDERVAVDMMKRGALDYVVKDADFLGRLPAVVSRAVKQVEQGRKLAVAESALKREHAFVTAVLETAGALVVVLDRVGNIVRFNRACERSTGYLASQMIGQPVWKLMGRKEEHASAREGFERLRNGLEFSAHENHWRAVNGEDHLIAWSNTILRDASGQVEYIVATGIDITDRRQLEKELLSIEEKVQQRIGHDLHDDLCQRLAGIEIMSQVLEQQLGSKSKTMAGRAAEISQLVRDAISHTRALARGLSPVVMEVEGITAALQQLAESTRSIFGVDCSFKCPEAIGVKDLSVATHLYRIAQEAVSNAIRHGEATRIDIALVKTPERVSLLVEDDGKGLPEQAARRRGMGLRIMRYRAGVIGGSLAVQKRKTGGTAVVCSVRVLTGKPHEKGQETSS
jgi:PAS domain S-box-containing protein